MEIDPFNDSSRWTIIGSRCDTPQLFVDEMHKLMRSAYGDELADFVESTIPPPYGTLVIK